MGTSCSATRSLRVVVSATTSRVTATHSTLPDESRGDTTTLLLAGSEKGLSVCCCAACARPFGLSSLPEIWFIAQQRSTRPVKRPPGCVIFRALGIRTTHHICSSPSLTMTTADQEGSVRGLRAVGNLCERAGVPGAHDRDLSCAGWCRHLLVLCSSAVSEETTQPPG